MERPYLFFLGEAHDDIAVKSARGVVDLDGPLLLARDREPGIVYRESLMAPPPRELWG